MSKEDAINNSYQILAEFKQRRFIYRGQGCKGCNCRGRSNKPRKFSEEEVMLYKMKHFKEVKSRGY